MSHTLVTEAEQRVGGLVRPRICTVPDCIASYGPQAIEWARRHGFGLDQEQEFVIENSLGMAESGRWGIFEVGVNAPRQNGKGEILMARELFGLYELEEAFIVHSAHEFKTSERHFQRVEAAIRRSPELFSQIKRSPSGRVIGFRYSHGDEAIELQDGRRIEFRTRTKSGMRGFDDVACLVLDEAMIFSEFAVGSMLPTVRASRAVRGPQLWYAGSAPDQTTHDQAIVWARVRERGLAGDDPSLAYFEWSLDFEKPEDVPGDVARDPTQWRRVNWAIERGRVLEEHMAREQRAIPPRQFAVELLGVGDWPRTDGLLTVIDLKLWQSLVDPASTAVDPVAFAFDVNPERTKSSIGVVGRRSDGLLHVEVIDQHDGTEWIVRRLVELQARHRPAAIVCDGVSPAASLIAELEQAFVKVKALDTREHAQACGLIFDAIQQKRLRHGDQPGLNWAISGAAQRTLGESWAWSRKNSSADITPLVVITLGTWAIVNRTKPKLFVAVA